MEVRAGANGARAETHSPGVNRGGHCFFSGSTSTFLLIGGKSTSQQSEPQHEHEQSRQPQSRQLELHNEGETNYNMHAMLTIVFYFKLVCDSA